MHRSGVGTRGLTCIVFHQGDNEKKKSSVKYIRQAHISLITSLNPDLRFRSIVGKD